MKKNYALLGIVGPLVYILAVIIGGAIRNDYSALYNAISELTMANAPNKLLLDVLFGIYNIFLLIFGLGAYFDTSINNKKFKVSTLMLVIIGFLGLSGTNFHTRSQRSTSYTSWYFAHTIIWYYRRINYYINIHSWCQF